MATKQEDFDREAEAGSMMTCSDWERWFGLIEKEGVEWIEILDGRIKREIEQKPNSYTIDFWEGALSAKKKALREWNRREKILADTVVAQRISKLALVMATVAAVMSGLDFFGDKSWQNSQLKALNEISLRLDQKRRVDSAMEEAAKLDIRLDRIRGDLNKLSEAALQTTSD